MGSTFLVFAALALYFLLENFAANSFKPLGLTFTGMIGFLGMIQFFKPGYGYFDKTSDEFCWKSGIYKFVNREFKRRFHDITSIKVTNYGFNSMSCFGIWLEFKDGKAIEIEKIGDKESANKLARQISSFVGNKKLFLA